MADVRDWIAHWFPPLSQAAQGLPTQMPNAYSQMQGAGGQPLLDPRVQQMLQAEDDARKKSLGIVDADQQQSQALAEQEFQRQLNLQPSDLELFNMATKARRR